MPPGSFVPAKGYSYELTQSTGSITHSFGGIAGPETRAFGIGVSVEGCTIMSIINPLLSGRLHEGDVIAAVDGEAAANWGVRGPDMTREVVARLNDGLMSSKVTLTIYRPTAPKDSNLHNLTLVRDTLGGARAHCEAPGSQGPMWTPSRRSTDGNGSTNRGLVGGRTSYPSLDAAVLDHAELRRLGSGNWGSWRGDERPSVHHPGIGENSDDHPRVSLEGLIAFWAGHQASRRVQQGQNRRSVGHHGPLRAGAFVVA